MSRLLTLLSLAGLMPIVMGHSVQDRGNAVTYEAAAKRADVVIQEIAAQTGLQLHTSDDAKKHILIVSVRDANVDTLLQKIAQATSSKWTETQAGRTMVPDDAVRKAELAKRDAERVKEFKDAQASFKKRLERKPVPDEEMGDADFYMSFDSPGEKALAQLAQLINANEVAKLDENGRIVFSTAPNRMQRAMTSSQATRVLNTLVAEHNKWAAEEIKNNEELMADPEWAAYMAMYGDANKPKLFEGPPAKALMIVEMDSSFFGMSMESARVKLVVYDRKGTAIVNASLGIGGWYDNFMEEVPEPELEIEGRENITEQQQEEILPEDRELVKFSKKSELLGSLENMDESSFTLPEPLLELLRDPVAHDPLGFHHSDMLFAIAKAKKLNVVANLSDSEVMDAFGTSSSKRGVSVGQAYRMLTDEDTSVTDLKDGWLVVTSTDPTKGRELRQDRTVLKQFVAGVERDGSASLDALASFALVSPSPMQNGTSMLYMLAFAPQTFQGMLGESMDWPTLQFYGSLLPGQKASLRQGARLRFGDLSAQARGIVSKMAFGADAKIKTAESLAKETQLPAFLQMMGGFMGDMFGGGDSDYTEEPTEVMPNGLPANGAVDLKVAFEPIAQPSGGQSMFLFAFGSLGADEIAMFELMKEASQAEEGGGMMDMVPLPKNVRMGSRERLKFTFWLSPQAGISKGLLDDKMPKNAPTVSFDNLPAEFKALIAERKKALKESSFFKMFGGIGTL